MELKEMLGKFKDCGDGNRTLIADNPGYTNEYAFDGAVLAISVNPDALDVLERIGEHIDKELFPAGVYSLNMRMPKGVDVAIVSGDAIDGIEALDMPDGGQYALADMTTNEIREKYPADERGEYDIDIGRHGVQFNFTDHYSDDKLMKYMGFESMRMLFGDGPAQAPGPK